jgi:hypothetical protein
MRSSNLPSSGNDGLIKSDEEPMSHLQIAQDSYGKNEPNTGQSDMMQEGDDNMMAND